MRIINNDTSTLMDIFLPNSNVFRLLSLIVFIMVIMGNSLKAQIEVTANQELAFGSFVTGSTGGTVVISPEGNRSVTGTVTGLAFSPVSAAVFEVSVKGNKRFIHFQFQEPAQLIRSGGSESMTVTNFTSDKPGNSFVTTSGSETYTVNVGATLNVQNSTVNPPGDYNGTFSVTFIRE